MNARNLLNPADYIIPIPMGIPTTLQYNQSGNLEKVYVGYNKDRVDHTKDMFNLILENNTAPATVRIKNGTTWVQGIIYTAETLEVTGEICDAVENAYIDRFIQNPKQFHFFAGNIESTASVLKTAAVVNQYLKISKFDTMAGWVVPSNINPDYIENLTNTEQYTFTKTLSRVFIFRVTDVRIIELHNKQYVVDSIKQYTDDNGYVNVKVSNEDSTYTSYIDYSDLIKLNILKGSVVFLDSDYQIKRVHTTNTTKRIPRTLTCKFCGRVYNVPDQAPTVCPNVHCTSRIKTRINTFLYTLGLEEPENLTELLTNKEVTCIPDLLILDKYKDIDIELTFTQLLRSLVPVALITNTDVFTAFGNACNNNETTFRFYVNSPELIPIDLDIHHKDLNRLMLWLSDRTNASDIECILNTPNVTLKASEKKFEGAPIFRDKTILLTGEFIHGSYTDITSILRSYSASISTAFSNMIDCVITGGTKESIDGRIINQARVLGIPVFDELEFFAEYEIDSDLHDNFIY